MDALLLNLTTPWGVNLDNIENTGAISACSGRPLPEHAVCMSDPEEMLKPWLQNPMFFNILIVHLVALLFGLLGNVLVIIVMVVDRKSRNATNQFLVSLAVADLLLLVLCAPLDSLQYFVTQWDEEGSVCKMSKYAELLSATVSVLNLTAVTLERFIVIVFPMKSRALCTMSNGRRAIFVVWLIAFFLSIPAIVTKGTTAMTFMNDTTNITLHYCNDISEKGIPFAIYQFAVLFAAPGLLMVICYACVIKELWKSTRSMRMLTNNLAKETLNGNRRGNRGGTRRGNRERELEGTRVVGRALSHYDEGTSQNSDDSSTCGSGCTATKPKKTDYKGDEIRNARKQVIKMLILVVLLFLFCWGPRIIMEMIIKFGLVSFTPSIYNMRVMFNVLPFVHACMNPFIYSFMSKNFRRSLYRQAQRLGVMNNNSVDGGGNSRSGYTTRSRETTVMGSSYQSYQPERQMAGGASSSSSPNRNMDMMKYTEVEMEILTTSSM